MNSDNDVQYDEEFYKYLCHGYGEALRFVGDGCSGGVC